MKTVARFMTYDGKEFVCPKAAQKHIEKTIERLIRHVAEELAHKTATQIMIDLRPMIEVGRFDLITTWIRDLEVEYEDPNIVDLTNDLCQ